MSYYLLAHRSVWPLICADNSVSVPWRLQAQSRCYEGGSLPFLFRKKRKKRKRCFWLLVKVAIYIYLLNPLLLLETDLCNSWCPAQRRSQLPLSWCGSHGSSAQPKRQAGSSGRSSGNFWRNTVSACSSGAKMLWGGLWRCSYSSETDPEQRQKAEKHNLTWRHWKRTKNTNEARQVKDTTQK